MEATKEKILSALKEVQDPDLHRDIISLGMLKEIHIEGGKVCVSLSTASSSEELRFQLQEKVRQQLLKISDVTEVQVEISNIKGNSPFAAKTPLPGIQNIIAVASGKGGVGKTTVSVNLSIALSRLGYQVGLMDGDIYGPNVPLMLGIPPETRPHVNKEEKMIPLEAHGIKMISMGVLVPADQPMIWRGPRLHSAVTQLLQKVEWGTLDYLLIDLPPGTGDVQLSLVQSVPLTGAVMVTTPQEVALMDVRKGILMFQKTQVPILGIIENMAGDIFGRDGGKMAAQQFHTVFLGQVPLEADVRIGGDAGNPVTAVKKESPVARIFMKIAEDLVEILSAASR